MASLGTASSRVVTSDLAGGHGRMSAVRAGSLTNAGLRGRRVGWGRGRLRGSLRAIQLYYYYCLLGSSADSSYDEA